MFSQTPLCGPLPSDDGQAWTVCGGSGALDVLVDVDEDADVEREAEDDADPEFAAVELDPLAPCVCELELRAPESL